jgi:hypothetical protein
MTKSFKIARKPGQVVQETKSDEPVTSIATAKAARQTKANDLSASAPPRAEPTPTTRKTIEVPEDYFYQVKLRALQRHVREKDLWAEILEEYFKNHPIL